MFYHDIRRVGSIHVGEVGTNSQSFQTLFCLGPGTFSRPVIYLDWSGVDLKPDPLHPPNIRFKARSATELQCSYILFIVSLGTNLV